MGQRLVEPGRISGCMKRFIVGVTGHRKLPDTQGCTKAIGKVIEDIRKRVMHNDKECDMIMLSPLAEGADRLVAHEWLQYKEHVLECPLPLELDEYIKDFITAASRREFASLLAQCRKRSVMKPEVKRSAAYRSVGVHIVDNCDLLLALWDGQSPDNRAGTAAIVEYARKAGKPIYWINTNNPEEITGERLDEIFS